MTKNQILLGIATAINSDEILPNNKVVLLTTCGLITADFVYSNDTSDKVVPLRALMKGISQAVNGSTENADNNIPQLVGDNKSIMLKNVTILQNGQSKFSIPSMILYYDDIIGISIGNAD